MSALIESLRKLQAIDGELYRLRNELKLKPLMLEETKQRVAEQQANTHASDARLKTVQLQQKEKEIELSTKESNVKKLQAQLFQVKTNKEYSVMQQEIERSKADASLLEEEILQVIDAIEQTKQAHQQHLAALAKQQDALKAEEARVNTELEVLAADIAALDEKRKGLIPTVEPQTLNIYERILNNRDGLALVPLVNDSCGGCHMVQPPQVVNEALIQDKLVMCGSCSRILYADEVSAS